MVVSNIILLLEMMGIVDLLNNWAFYFLFIYIILLIIASIRKKVLESVKVNLWIGIVLSLLFVSPELFKIYPLSIHGIFFSNILMANLSPTFAATSILPYIIGFPLWIAVVVQKSVLYTFIFANKGKIFKINKLIFKHQKRWGYYILTVATLSLINAILFSFTTIGNYYLHSLPFLLKLIHILVFILTVYVSIKMIKSK